MAGKTPARSGERPEADAKLQHLHQWRVNDYEDCFTANDGGNKGYLNGREQKRFMVDMGMSIWSAGDLVKRDQYLPFEKTVQIAEDALPQEKMQQNTLSLFQWHDRQQSPTGRVTGLVDRATVESALEEHGMDEEELYLLLSPYTRRDGKIDYDRLLRDLFPPDDPPA